MEPNNMQKDITDLQINHALLEQRQAQTDSVIMEIKDTLKSLNKGFGEFRSQVQRAFYIAVGAILVYSGSVTDLLKLAVKFAGG